MYNAERSEITHVIYDDVMTRKGDRGESVEMMVDIYESVDTVRHHDLRTHTEKHQPLQHTGSVSVKNRKHRAAEVCLCLLCFLLLTAVIVLCVCLTSERKQLLTHISNLTEEREKIFTNNTKLIAEKEHLLKKNKILIEEREQIKNKTDELLRGLYEQDQRAENFKWIYYNFSFYYISSERKSWSYSRQDCHQRGADLVIINSRGEQDFLQKIAAFENFWIGLKMMQGVWKWHDGAAAVNRYWTSRYLRSYGYCALMTSSGWADESCTYHKKWICKRTILK
ncbi:CD209 antigen-like isoform X1 [Onychostoma macrolepis]|uniref:CD209 antigen-like isoform X1 n=1 Tax=Onychostoma macrolepis TaxID=369639 RepID=UPI00272B7B32|nr:CD209 antigen-like isoform X1 [Onychostoma macrolepis]